MKKIIVVGSGFSGSIIARKIAEELNREVELIERRSHIGGNMYDAVDEKTGVLVQCYGPHYLNTNKYSIINIDDENSKEFIKHIDSNILTYGIEKNADIKGEILRIDSNGSLFTVNSFPFSSKLLGEFNIYNCLSIISLLTVYNLSYLDFAIFIKSMNPIDGRMNKYTYNDMNFVIDYAHTYSAVKESINCVRKLAKKNLYIILGCGGNREKEKRYMIGSLLNEINANIILTIFFWYVNFIIW